jgi:hypothetical protein
MAGYRTLFKVDIQSKTLENSYLTMKSKVWTNEKRYKSGADQEVQKGRCKLCNDRENTMHLMFECERYSESLWNTLETVVKNTLKSMGDDENMAMEIRRHAYIVMYNVTEGVPQK